MAAALASPSASATGREEIAFLDVETSAPPACVLLEFGAIVICSRSLVDVSAYATLVRPADPDAAVPVPTARCNGITRDTVADAPPFRDVADKVYDVLHGRVWAGHNIVKFDSMIIREAFAEIGRPPPQHKGMIDTLPLLTRWFGPRAGDMKMASLANYFGLGKQRHRSLDDVKMNIDVFKNCATVLFLEASLREVLTVQNMLESATIRNQGTDDPATNRDLSGELVGSHVEEMVLDTTMQMDAASSDGFSGFVELEDVSTESIEISVMPLHPFGPRKIVQHKGAQLQLSCPGLQVRWGSTNCKISNAGRIAGLPASLRIRTNPERTPGSIPSTHCTYLRTGLVPSSSESFPFLHSCPILRMEHTLLKDVNMLSQQWTVRVRLTRFTEFMNTDKPPKVAHIDVVLLDEQGTTMEGQVLENRIPFFRARIKEDCVYEISFFQVCDARMKYRPVNHQFMMRFTQHTTVQEITPIPPGFPEYACNIVPYEVLRSRAGNRDMCSDAIGLFTGCSHVRAQNTRNGVKRLREVYLTNGREDIVVTLWEHHAEKFDGDQYINMGAKKPLVILFVGVTCLLFNDKLSLQSASSCKWYVDPDIPQTEEIKISCGATTVIPAWAKKNPSQSDPERITVYQLSKFTNPHVIFTNRYITEVKIKALLPGRPWWYPACKTCQKGTIPSGEGVICKNRNCMGTVAAPRYRLAIIAEDPAQPATDHEPSSIELVVFGPKAQELIGLPVECLITDHTHDEDFVPGQITNLYGKCFELSLSVSPYSLQNPTIIYQVDAIIGAVTRGTVSEASASNALIPQKDTLAAVHAEEVIEPNKDGQVSDSSQPDDDLLSLQHDKSTAATVTVTASVLAAPEVAPHDPETAKNNAYEHHSEPILTHEQKEAATSGGTNPNQAVTEPKEQAGKTDTSLAKPELPTDLNDRASDRSETRADMTPLQAVLPSQEVTETTSRGRKRRVPEKLRDGAEETRDEPLTKERSSKRRLEFSG